MEKIEFDLLSDRTIAELTLLELMNITASLNLISTQAEVTNAILEKIQSKISP